MLVLQHKQFAALQRFFVAMSLYPDVQKRAQAELDSVVGQSRIPDADDREQLPYVDALVKELLRWYPTVPLGVARCTLAADEYNGYLIPKGAVVLFNVWCVERFPFSRRLAVVVATSAEDACRAMMHDEKEFPDPERFSPERHLKKEGGQDPDGLDPMSIVFGLGRRCVQSRL